MEKSSSSLKKKRSKKSSKAKASSKSKKSRKYKSKKVRLREVSLSSSDSDDSKSLDALTSSSSEDSYRRRRDRSRTGKDAKCRKRKARGRSYSRDSSEDSHFAKRKKVKRKHEHDEVRKKPIKKKKIKREANVDLMSSRSRSCSTCQDGSTSSDDGQYKSRKGRSERKDKDKRLRGRSRSRKSSRYRARSSSSCSPCSENSYEVTEEKHIGENNSRWLRSVITVTKETEEYGELCRNENNEEIVDDHDYPCRSNDSNDGGTKRELDHHTPLSSEEKWGVEDEVRDMDADLNFAEPKLRDGGYSGSSSAGTSEPVKETNETSGANVNDDELELILRQRALENLRKFRGEMQSTAKAIPDQKNKIVSQLKQPISDKHEQVLGNSVVTDATVETKFDKRTPGDETNLPVQRRNIIACPRDDERFSNMDKDVSGSAKCHLACAPEKVIDSDNSSGTVNESANYNTANLELTKQMQNSMHDSLQASASHEPSNAKSPMTEGDVERNAVKTTEAESIDNNGRDGDVSSIENKSGKLQDESNQRSQFEQKTMTVMRGGEMVQVSYKVYIPNKVPALARRQLKR